MRIVMASGSPYVPATGGAYKANRVLAEGLAARGHRVRVLALARTAIRRGATLEQFTAELARLGIDADVDGPAHRFELAGVAVCALDGALAVRDELERELAEPPDWVLVSSEDWRQTLLAAALERAPGRVVYLAHTTTALPVGPASSDPHPRGAELLARTAAVVAPSHWLAGYLRAHAPAARVVTQLFPVFGAPPFPRHDTFDSGAVTLVNPCAVKGIDIFVALARARPELAFAAVPGWGTTDADRAQLAALPNVRSVPGSERIDDIFAQTSVLLVPSLWQEVYGLIAVEAMLRGIPVIASDAGGLPEAMLGVDFTIPVAQITRYKPRAVVPTPLEVPPQDPAPWLAALDRLADRAFYSTLAERGRRAAHELVARLDVGELERLLASEHVGRGQ